LAVSEVIPVYFVRFEDLVDEPYPTLIGLFSFILGVPESLITNTILDKRIINLIEEQAQGGSSGILSDAKSISSSIIS
jgi:hypothetical protein